MLKYLWLSLVVLVADQLTKWIVLSELAPYESVEILPIFNLVLVFNTGAAFSFLSDAGGWQKYLFAGLAIVMSVVLVIWLLRLDPGEKLTAIALSLVIGGAIGNLVDRLLYGHVVDFLDFHWQTMHWPAFNLADSAISLGVIALFLDIISQARSSRA